MSRWLKIIKRYAAYLASKGKTALSVLRTGETLFKHYYPLWVTRAKKGEGTTRWPNIVIHEIFNTFKPELKHDHGRFVCSIILSGGYTEVRYTKDGASREVVRRPFSVAFLWWNEWHNIKDVQPDTWTLFAFGPRFRDAYVMHPITGKILTRADAAKLDKQRVSGYHADSSELQAKIARRQTAMLRLHGDRHLTSAFKQPRET
jgi:hypothetical protein